MKNKDVQIKVSIIIPSYNRGSLLLKTLNSVQNQSLHEWECIVIDDGSANSTANVIEPLIKNDNRFKYYQRPQNCPKGAASCRNFGFQKSRGKYIQWLDDDDLLSKNKLELQVAHLEEINNNKIFATCDWDLLWPGKEFQKRNLVPSIGYLDAQDFFYECGKQQTFLPIHSFLFPRDLILRSGLWNVHLTLNDDAEFLCRIIISSDRLVNTEGCHVWYREHDEYRISRQKGDEDLKSLILSHRLMHAHLNFANIESKAFFKMKLLKIFHAHWNSSSELLKRHFFFFKENGINLNYGYYYRIKHDLYRITFPWYKKNFLKKIS